MTFAEIMAFINLYIMPLLAVLGIFIIAKMIHNVEVFFEDVKESLKDEFKKSENKVQEHAVYIKKITNQAITDISVTTIKNLSESKNEVEDIKKTLQHFKKVIAELQHNNITLNRELRAAREMSKRRGNQVQRLKKERDELL